MVHHIRHIATKIPLIMRVVSLYVVAGVPLFLIYSSQPPVPKPVLAQAPRPVQTLSDKKITTGQPVQMSVPRIGMGLEIIPGVYNYETGEWTLTEDKAHYATMTPQLNTDTGMTMIYGHNTDIAFWPLQGLVAGDELLITASNGKVFVYTYTGDRFVEPTDVSVLAEPSPKPRVVLMTCEGWLSETRRLMYFDFKEVR